MPKTCVLFIDGADIEPIFLILEGVENADQFDGVYINMMWDDSRFQEDGPPEEAQRQRWDELQDELNELLYEEDGGMKDEFIVDRSAFVKAIREGADLICCGFLP